MLRVLIKKAIVLDINKHEDTQLYRNIILSYDKMFQETIKATKEARALEFKKNRDNKWRT
jgi:hypothetical protein